MRVLLISKYDSHGGAPRAARRLHFALEKLGIESTMLVDDRQGSDPWVLGPRSKLGRVAIWIRTRLAALPLRLRKAKPRSLFGVHWLRNRALIKRINGLKPDLVHLQWVGAGMLSPRDICAIKAPILWTLHDNEPFTGGCHIAGACRRYEKQCGRCPVLGSNKEHDLSYHQQRMKRVLARKKLHFVGVSSWISEAARLSTVARHMEVETIANPLDTSRFAPVEQRFARGLCGLPIEGFFVLFGAVGGLIDKNKGFDLLVEALSLLEIPFELVVFGSSRPDDLGSLPCKAHFLGKLTDDAALVAAYNACDVMVVPSVQESFGQTATEAMACGVPVVAFGATGLLDIVDHLKNGYLAKPYSTQDLARGIQWTFDHPDKKLLSAQARQKCVSHFDQTIIAEKTRDLYNRVLQDGRGASRG